MPKLVITDIPRIKAIFQQIDPEGEDLVVVSEIHRGIEELDRLEPDLVIIQNHLSGISADIILKHFRSRTGERSVRYALINASSHLSPEIEDSYELVIDPNLADQEITADLDYLLHGRGKKPERKNPEPPEPETPAITAPPLKQSEIPPEPFDSTGIVDLKAITYQMPRKPNARIVSAFSQQLDSNSPVTRPSPIHGAPVIEYYRDRELAIRDLHNKEHLLIDPDIAVPVYRRPGFILLSATIVLVVAITAFQHSFSGRKKELPLDTPPVASKQPAMQASSVRQPPVPVPPAPTEKPAATAAQAAPGQLASHGPGRLRTPPSFLPLSGKDPSYSKDNPGWENFKGLTNEYRVFKDNDGTIKALQVIDRSGTGIQDSFYTSALKELAGATAMRTTSSEIKEGYEIRRGEVAGLQIVQYRDAQGGRLRGFVVTWP